MTPQLAPAPQRGLALRPLPVPLRAVGGVFRVLRWTPWPIDPERMLRAAGRMAGLPPRLDAHVEAALEVLCRSLVDEAHLHWFGRANQWEFIVTGLAALLRLEDLFRRRPELDEVPLVPPLVVTGLPRSGTTFLHRLLCDAPDARPIPFWEHVHPVAPTRLDLRRLDVELKFVPWRMVADQYAVDAIHYVRPREADECNFSLRLGLRSMVFWSTAPVYGYLRWLLAQDMQHAYRTYRRVLQLVQLRAPGKRLTLKCPSHAAFLPALRTALPEAMIVLTHREPRVLAASEGSLILALQATATRQLDWRCTVAANLEKVQTYADRLVAFADTDTDASVHHVDYRRLLTEPVAVAREIRTGFGLPFDDEHERLLSRHARDNVQHKHGRHHYTLESFELDSDDLDHRFAAYRRRFAPWLP